MQLTQFNAYCPFEVGDRIRDTAGRVHTITDIACVHYVRGGNVEFRFELDNSGYYAPITAQDPPAKEQAGTLAEQIGPTKPFPTSTFPGPIRKKKPQAPPRSEHDGKRVRILICDESSQLPPEFKEFIKKRFG